MHTPQSILQMVQKGSWLASVDLKDAYFHVPIHLDFRKYMRLFFRVRFYQFKVLSFGLSTASKVFTKMLALIIVLLHQKSVHLYPYLDDILILAESQV